MPRPYVRVNVAMTVDGKIDSVARAGAVISSPEDLARVDRLRRDVDAVLVGGRTLLDGDPRLTIKSSALRQERLAQGMPENPAKAGVVSVADLRLDSRFLTAGPARRLVYTTSRTAPDQIARLQAAGAEVFVFGQQRVDLEAMLESQSTLGIRLLLVEGGGTLITELFRLSLVDELLVYLAPRIFGGAAAPTLVDGRGFMPEQSPLLKLVEVEEIDPSGGILLHYSL